MTAGDVTKQQLALDGAVLYVSCFAASFWRVPSKFRPVWPCPAGCKEGAKMWRFVYALAAPVGAALGPYRNLSKFIEAQASRVCDDLTKLHPLSCAATATQGSHIKNEGIVIK